MSLARNMMLVAALTGLSGCAYSELRLSDDFGQAVRQGVVAQVADPDARYTGVPAAGSIGARVASAQTRYQTGRVIQPVASSSSTISPAGAPQSAPAGP